MPVPDFQKMLFPVLKLTADGQPHGYAEAIESMTHEFQLSREDQTELLQTGQTRLYNRVCWTVTYLKKAVLLEAAGWGLFKLTDRGRQLLASGPTVVDAAFLEGRYPEVAEFRKGNPQDSAMDEPPASFDTVEGKWGERVGVESRIRDKIHRHIPNDAVRRAALEFLGFAIDTANEARGDAWFVRERTRGLRVMAGRLIACEARRSKMRVSIIGPLSDDLRTTLGAKPENDEEFKKLPGALLLTFPIEDAGAALPLLKERLSEFVDRAMERVRSTVSLEDHSPEAVAYISQVIARDLPQPRPAAETEDSDELDDGLESEEPLASRQPRVRGRAPIFEHGQRSIASLVSDIERGAIALPELQRPFVWEDTKVRDLLDSLFVGFPVGTLVFWHTSTDKDARAMGAVRPGLRATTLVIDGQQRLTSLYAVMRGADVIDEDGLPRSITIAFRPRDGRFEVTDAAIRNDPEFLPNVTELWGGTRPKPRIRRDLMAALRAKGRTVNEEYEDAVERNLDRAHSITEYRFPTVDIRKTASSQDEEATEEDVAEIFVRINNQGTRLGQADFVLTLLSVFHGELRERIEERSRAMSQGAVGSIDTQQLLRAVCGVAFERARMSAVYRYLRGVDPTTGEADTSERLRRLSQLDDAANECMETTPWRDYLLRVQHAGFVTESLIASKNAIVNAYVFYIRGRRIGVPKRKLDESISRWIFGSLLTARYSRSSETIFEQDLARVARLAPSDTDGFVGSLDDALADIMTGDYWIQTLVSALETQKGRAPAALAFRAAQIILGTRALFSDQFLRNLLDPPADGARAASEAHHLFPEAWLSSRGIRDRRLINQVANLADVGWHENNIIGGRGPAGYVPILRRKFGIDNDRWGRLCAEHALPVGWESMKYEEFLRERRRRMADLIRVAFRQLGGEADAPALTPPWFLPGAEEVWKRIAVAEHALRGLVRDVYVVKFDDAAARGIEDSLPERERQTLAHALRARPAGADPLSIVDYLYLGQLPPLLFQPNVWQHVKQRLNAGPDPKQQLQTFVNLIAPVRNEIAHVREVNQDRLLRASMACTDLLQMLQLKT